MDQTDLPSSDSQPSQPDKQLPYEEISEKKTSVLGYILLIIMAGVIIAVGEAIFSDLSQIPEKPIHPSRCIIDAVSNLERRTSISCPSYAGFNQVDEKFNLPQQFTQVKTTLEDISVFNKTIQSNNTKINQLERDIQKLNQDYDLSLQETIAQEQAITDKDAIKQNITTARSSIAYYQDQNQALNREKMVLETQISTAVEQIKVDYQQAADHYENTNAWYKFKVFALTLIFITPLFAVAVYFYLKLKKNNSPYTIILTAITAALAILFIQVILTFLYEILPKEWIERIFEFFRQTPLLRYVIYYGSVALVIAIFGGVVYFIQRKIFNPQKVAIRRLKDNKCPSCSFHIDADHSYCPSCGIQLKQPCAHCQQLRFIHLKYCPHCGQQ